MEKNSLFILRKVKGEGRKWFTEKINIYAIGIQVKERK